MQANNDSSLAHHDLPQTHATVPALSDRAWDGLPREYRDIVVNSTEAPAPAPFHLISLLVAISVLLARKVWVNWPRPMFANLYGIIIGATSRARKTTAYTIAIHLMDMITQLLGKEVRPLYGIASAEGLAEVMQGEDGMSVPVLVVEDEFRSLMLKAQQKSVGNLIPKLTELFNAGAKFEVPTRSNPICVEKPLIGLISATTKVWLTESVDVGDAASGFLNRFIMAEAGESTTRIAIPVPLDDDKLRSLAERIAERIGAAEGEYRLSPEAVTLYERFYEQFYDRPGTETALALTERAHIHIIKIALIYAVLNGHSQIEHVDVARAIAVVDFSMEVAASLAPHLGLSRVGKLEQRIVSYLRKHKGMKFRDLYRALSVSADELNKALTPLIKSGEVIEPMKGGIITLA